MVNLANLSPGEKLILLLLIWQFIFNNYEVYGSTVLLFDEPDAHLHPIAVHDLIKILEKLVHLGIQIIFTSHFQTSYQNSKLIRKKYYI